MPRRIQSDLPERKRKLLDSGVELMRTRGFNGTTVDDICAKAGVTKGSFFHYFKSKDEIAKAALVRFYEAKIKALQDAPFRNLADPLDRVFGRLDFQCEAIEKRRTGRGCLIGMFAQELALTHREINGDCQSLFVRFAGDFEVDLAEAKALHAPMGEFDPKSVAMLYLSIFEGSLILTKVARSSDVLLENIEHFRRYLRSLFGRARRVGRKEAAAARAGGSD